MPYTPVTTSYTDPMAIHLRDGFEGDERVHNALSDAIVKLRAIEKVRDTLTHQGAYEIHATNQSDAFKLSMVGSSTILGEHNSPFGMGAGSDVSWTVGLADITDGYDEVPSFDNIRVYRGAIANIKTTADGYEFKFGTSGYHKPVPAEDLPRAGDIIYIRL